MQRQATEQFQYDLPPDLIATHPAEPRGASRLLVHTPATPSCEAFASAIEERAAACAASSATASPQTAEPKRLWSGGAVFDLRFADLPAVLPPYAHLVFNQSRVFAARVYATLPPDGVAAPKQVLPQLHTVRRDCPSCTPFIEAVSRHHAG